MKFTIDTRSITALRDRFSAFSGRRFNAAMATALTRTAGAVRDAERHEMLDVFKSPTPYTLNSLYVQPATAAKLEARVGIKDQASGGRAAIKWLRWQVNGGLRRWTGFERALIRGGAMPDDMRAVPGNFARLDSFGNVSRGQMQQILSQLRIENPLSGSLRATPRIKAEDDALTRRYKTKAIRRAYSRAGGEFVAFPYGRGKLRAGIYIIRNSHFGRANPQPIFIFVTKAEYQAIFDFAYTARLAIGRALPVEIKAALADQLQRLLKKQAGA